METKTIRYGVVVPDKGYLLHTSLHKKMAFVSDAVKASRTGSYEESIHAKHLLDKVREMHPSAELVEYQTSVVAVQVDPPQYNAIFMQYLLEYATLKERYESMNANQVMDIPNVDWNHYKALEHQLQIVGLI